MATTNEIAQLVATLAKLTEALAKREDQATQSSSIRVAPDRVMLTVEEAADRLGIGRTLMFKLVRTGEVASVRIGRLRRVPASAIQEYTSQLVDGTTNRNAA